MTDRPQHCRACGAHLRWVETSRGKWKPLDYDPVPDGNVVLHGDVGTGIALARVLKKDEEPEPYFLIGRFVSHFSTCPQAARFRRK